jgi:hypothetical protein
MLDLPLVQATQKDTVPVALTAVENVNKLRPRAGDKGNDKTDR